MKTQPKSPGRRGQKPAPKISIAKEDVRFCGVGVDLVDLGRIRGMLHRHGAQTLRRLLSEPEKLRSKKKRLTALELAKKFAAKEAYFKALGGSWTGEDYFSRVDVQEGAPGRFRVFSTKASSNRQSADGSFFYDKRWVGAQVLLWENDRGQNSETRSRKKRVKRNTPR